MSLQEVREKNKRLVIEKALILFMKNGIDQTKIKEIASAAGLTERSIYRYFETKTDIVEAAAHLFYQITTKEVQRLIEDSNMEEKSGMEQIKVMLNYYSSMYFENPEGVRFTLDAEIFLYHSGRNIQLLNWLPHKFEISDSPLVRAIYKGIEDGSVSAKVDVKVMYYNVYESILGVMQKMAYESVWASEQEKRERMKQLRSVFIKAFQEK